MSYAIVNNAINAVKRNVIQQIQNLIDTNPQWMDVCNEVLQNDDDCTTMLSRESDGEWLVELYPGACNYGCENLHIADLKSIRQHKLSRALDADELARLGDNVLELSINGIGYNRYSDGGWWRALTAKDINDLALDVYEDKLYGSLTDRLSNHVLRINDENIVVESTREECERLNVPSNRIIVYYEHADSNRCGTLVAAHRKYGVPIDASELDRLKLNIRLADVHESDDKNILDTYIEATVE